MPKCRANGCEVRASIGMERDLIALTCAKHRERDMVNVVRRQCSGRKDGRACKEPPIKGYEGCPRATRCEEHVLESMVMIIPMRRKAIKNSSKVFEEPPPSSAIFGGIKPCRYPGCREDGKYHDPYAEGFYLCEEHALADPSNDYPKLAILTPCILITSTIAYKTSLRGDFNVIAQMETSDKVLAVKSVAIDIDKCHDNPYMGAQRIIRKQTARNEAVIAGDTSRKQKTTPGNGLYFHASVEFVIQREEHKLDRRVRPYKVRLYPSTGTAQITGVQLPLETGERELQYVLDIVASFLGIEPISIQSRSINMMNFKHAVRGKPDEEVRLYTVASVFSRLVYDPSEAPPPFPFHSVTDPSEASAYIYVRFSTPTEKNSRRYTTFKIYTKKKITIFAAPTFEIAASLTVYMDSIFEAHRSEFIVDLSYRTQRPPIPLTEEQVRIVNSF